MVDRYREPDFAPWNGERVPLTFLSGYLGSGKTTLINRVLAAADRPVAVFVNDVGEVNVDARLIRRHEGETIELDGGCVCCSLIDGFGAAFDALRARPSPPDHLIVELSGVADPGRVLPWGRTAGFRLDGVVTLVAADQLPDLLRRESVAPMIRAQIECADLLAVTRPGQTAAPSADGMDALLANINPVAPVMSADDQTLVSTLLRLGGRRPGGLSATPPGTLFDRHEIGAISLDQPIEAAEVEKILADLPDNVMRAKGVFMDASGALWAAHLVGSRRVVTPLPHAERQEPTDLVTIAIRD